MSNFNNQFGFISCMVSRVVFWMSISLIMPSIASAAEEIALPSQGNQTNSSIPVESALNGQIVAANSQVNFDDYLIGQSNLLEIKVAQDPQLARTLRVDNRGDITMPLIGNVHAEGLTAKQLEVLIAKKLEKDYINKPDVMVFIREYTSLKVIVQGRVLRPGIYSMTGRPTLMEAVTQAGGFDEKADQTNVKLVKAKTAGQKLGTENTQIFNVDLIKTAQQQDPVLESGDTIYAEEAVPIIVEGSVMKPGVIYPKSHTTLMQIISQAGGLRELGDGSSVRIYSLDAAGVRKERVFNLEHVREGKQEDPPLKPGNVVVVEESAGRALLYGVGRFFGRLIRFTPIPVQ
jgi:polysaccharide export outer membrane protein